MSEIDNGIKQPLRFYDEVSKQNFRQEWVKRGGLKDHHILICPENAIVPFQIRRRRSTAVITTFDLYSYDEAVGDFSYAGDVFSFIPAPLNNNLRVIQMETADNIVWYPQKDFSPSLPCGLHYIHISDGTNDWYSEVFQVVADFIDNTTQPLSFFSNVTITGSHNISKDGTVAGNLSASIKPF